MHLVFALIFCGMCETYQKICINLIGGNCPADYHQITDTGYHWENLVDPDNLTLMIFNNEEHNIRMEMRLTTLKHFVLIGQNADVSYINLDIKNFSLSLKDFYAENITIVFSNGISEVPASWTVSNMRFVTCHLVNSPDILVSDKIELDMFTVASEFALTAADVIMNVSDAPKTYIQTDFIAPVNADSMCRIQILGVHGMVGFIQYDDGFDVLVEELDFYGRFISGAFSLELVDDSEVESILLLQNVLTHATSPFMSNWGLNVYQLIYTCTKSTMVIWPWEKECIISTLNFVNITLWAIEKTKLYVNTLNCITEHGVIKAEDSEDVTLVLEEFVGSHNISFIGSVNYTIDDLVITSDVSNVTFSQLEFTGTPSLFVQQINQSAYGTLWNITGELVQDQVSICPYYQPTMIDVNNCGELVGKKMVSICAPDLNCSLYDIEEGVSSMRDIPPGFTADAMSFNLTCEDREVDRCVHLEFAIDPKNFTSNICVYRNSYRDCPEGYDPIRTSQLPSKLRTLNKHTTYVDIYIPENNFNNTVFNFDSMKPVKEMKIRSATNQKIWLEYTEKTAVNIRNLILENIILRLSDSSSTLHLKFETIQFGLNSRFDAGQRIDLSAVQSFHLHYTDHQNETLNNADFCGCKKIVFHDVSIDKIIFKSNGWYLSSSQTNSAVTIVAGRGATFDLVLSDIPQGGIVAYREDNTTEVIPLQLDLYQSTINDTLLTITDSFDGIDTTAFNIILDGAHTPVIYTEIATLPVAFTELPEASAFDLVWGVVKPKIPAKQNFTVSLIDPIIIQRQALALMSISAEKTDAKEPCNISVPHLYLNATNAYVSAYQEKAGSTSYTWGKYYLHTNGITAMESTSSYLVGVINNGDITMMQNSTLNVIQTNITGARVRMTASPNGWTPIIHEMRTIVQLPYMVTKETVNMPIDLNDTMPASITLHHTSGDEFSIADLDEKILSSEQHLFCTKESGTCEEMMDRLILEPSELELKDGIMTFVPRCSKSDGNYVACLAIKREVTPSTHLHMSTWMLVLICSMSVLGVGLIIMTVLLIRWYRVRMNPEDMIKQTLLEPPADY